MTLDVYGRKLEVYRHQGRWRVLLSGSDGKKRIAEDVMVPSHIRKEELVEYLADLCHEWSRPGRDQVVRLT